MSVIGTQPAVQQWRDLGATPPEPEYPPSNFETPQQAKLSSIGSTLQAISYNVDGEITSYVRGGVTHTVDYPDANTVVITNTQGYSKTITRSSGQVTSIV